ncbi:hypothetical protein FBT96_20060 [Rhodobacter capsulatus]|uniref:Rhodanese domain-containing protein n=1 Tax=Rhodobacter capsulatus TaxID=1061 RepID=A0A4V5PPB9_RHOCA|nr:hypothetical protein [Rhodobacter capsulatus]TKD12920.1 hypothetical protein FBT96_20060 [Rhodobacter capsulatus]
MSGVERQFWESFEGWARRRMAKRLAQAGYARWIILHGGGRRWSAECREQIACAREMRLGLAASVARGSSLGLPG